MATLGLTVFFAVIVAVSALLGLARGLNKAVIRLMTLVLAVILTFVIAGPITNLVAQSIKLEGLTLGEMVLEGVRSSEMGGALIDAVPLMREAVLVMPAFALSIVIFPVVFLLLCFISWIAFLCAHKPLRKLIFKESLSEEDAAAVPTAVRVGKRFGGLGVGIVAGVLIFGMIMTPIFGLFSILPEKSAMDDTLDAMADRDILSEAAAGDIQMAYAVTDCAVVKFYGAVGLSSAGRAYINSVSKIQADGNTVYLADELGSLMALAQTFMEGGLGELLQAAEDPNALYALLADKDFVDALMQELFRSQLLRAAVPEMMAIAMESAARGLNVPASKEAVYNNMMEDIALAVKNAGVDYAAVKAYEDVYGSVALYARSSGAAAAAASVDVMTEAEYEAQIMKLVELADAISSILNAAISGDNTAFTDSVALQLIEEVKTQASEEGQESIENLDASGVQTAISGIDSSSIDAGEGNAEALLEQLTDAQKFETDAATVETIKESIRESVKNALADETKAAETAGTLASVVSGLADAVSSATDEDGNIDASKLDFEKIAGAVTELQNSSLKDMGASLLDLVAAGDLGGSSMMGNVLGALKEGYENGEDIGGTISTAGALISLGAAMSGGEEGQEAMVNSLTSLINNLNDYTIGLLPSIVSTDTITGMGIPTEYADGAYGVIETLLKELMKLKGAEDYNNEVRSILSLYNLVTAGAEELTEEDIGELAGCAVESDAIYNTLVGISVSNPFGIEIGDDGAQAELAKMIESSYAESGKTQRELEVYNAIAMLLGLDAQVDLG